MGRCVVLVWVTAQALDNLVPQEQLSVIGSRLELSDYGRKLLWVKAQVEHAREATQAQQVSAALAPKWYRAVASPRIMRKLAAGGDWEGVNVLIGVVMTLARGKGKENGTSKGDSRAKGSSPKSVEQGRRWDVDSVRRTIWPKIAKVTQTHFHGSGASILIALIEQTQNAAVNQAVAGAVQAPILRHAPGM